MPSIGRPFRKGGVPRSAEALRALGMDVDDNLPLAKGEPEGVLDEIVLNEDEVRKAKEVEGWDRERMYQWAKTIGNDSVYNEAWVDRTFDFLPHGTIRSKMSELLLSYTQVKEIPPGLQVEVLGLSGTQVKEIPPGLQVEELYLNGTQVKEIPEDKGAIQKIYVGSAQAELKASAEARGIDVEIW